MPRHQHILMVLEYLCYTLAGTSHAQREFNIQVVRRSGAI